MDNLYYLIFTNVIILISLVVFIVLITYHIVKKKKFTLISYFILTLSFLGMYLFVPSRYLYLGYAFNSPELLEKAIKFSINPYEKRLSYLYMSDIFNYDILKEGKKDGNKAIDCLENALKGEYSKYTLDTEKLAQLYAIKGDFDKAIELNKILNRKQSLSLRYVYILKGEYQNAINTFKKDNISTDNFLKAELYKKIGNYEDAKKAQKLAEKAYNSNIKSIKIKSKRLEYDEKIDRYKTIEQYKNWLRQQALDYKFID